MDIFGFGMQMEKDGEEYYRDLAGKCNDKGLQNILNMLADDEVRHYNVLRDMADGTAPRFSETSILNNVKNVFVQEKEADKDFDFNVAQIELYKKARDIEKKSQEFYLEKSGEIESDIQKKIFERIAEEEKQHCWILENVIDFVSKPNEWLENAEWNKLEDY